MSLEVKISGSLRAVVRRLAGRRRNTETKALQLAIELYDFIATKLDTDKEIHIYDPKSETYTRLDLSRF